MATALWFLAGALYGAALVPARGFGRAVTQIVDELLPWLRRVWKQIVRVAKRIFHFFFGAIAGLIGGVIGSALFGTLLLGRPYFRYIIAEDFISGSFPRWVGKVALKFVALVAGVIFGVLGAVGGVIAAAPYALTAMLSTSFQWADLGGKPQRFFELWTRGTLPAELRRLNLITNRFDFNEKRKSSDLQLVHGWIRLANILPATIAAAVAGTIGGYVRYVASILNAYRDLKAGKKPPVEGGKGDHGAIWRSGRSGSKYGGKIGSHVAGWGALIFAGYLLFSGSLGFLAAVWKALWMSTLGFTGGWLAGLILGGLIGLAVGLTIWLGTELEPEPPSEPSQSGR